LGRLGIRAKREAAGKDDGKPELSRTKDCRPSQFFGPYLIGWAIFHHFGDVEV
jgi:hypothetical protein